MPSLTASSRHGVNCITAKHPDLQKTHLYCLPSPPPVSPSGEFVGDPDDVVEPDLLFTENNTNFARLYGGNNDSPYVKDAFHDHIIPSHRPPASESKEEFFSQRIRTRTASSFGAPQPDEPEQGPVTPFPMGPSYVSPNKTGTKSAAHYTFRNVPGQGGCAVVRLKMTPLSARKDPSVMDEGVFDDTVEARRQEADEFYNSFVFGPISDDLKQIMRQAYGGMLWTKQFYQFIQSDWLKGDPAQPAPPPERKWIRNKDWRHLHIADILSMPDKFVLSLFIFYLLILPQMGISLLCCVGHSLPLYSTRCRRPRICQEAARPTHP